jgi:hypothetical protein
MIPATDHNQFSLLPVVHFRVSELHVQHWCETFECLLDAHVRLVGCALVLGPDFQNERISLTRAVKNEAIIQVDKAAAKRQL